MRIAGLALILGLAALAATAATAEPVTAIWIDVRSAEEYAGGHLPGAINVPHDQITRRIDEITRDPEAPIRLYCRRGIRAQLAKIGLERRGYRNVRNEGSFAALASRRRAARGTAAECVPAGATTTATHHTTPQRGSHGQAEDC